MNFEPISQGEQLFSEINLLYLLFAENPYNGLAILSDSPYTAEHIKKAQSQSNTRWKIWENRDDDLPVPPHYAYAHYTFSSNDVVEYLSKRVWDLQTTLLKRMKEVSRSELADRLHFYVDYQKSLNGLKEQLINFKYKKDNNIQSLTWPQHTNHTEPYLASDWEGIYKVLNNFVSEIATIATIYINVIDRYLLELKRIKDELNPQHDGSLAISKAGSSSQKLDTQTYNSFKQLFKEPSYEAICLETLRKWESPIIEGMRWIHRKGNLAVLVVWLDRIEICGYIHVIPKKNLIPLLETYFEGLSISTRTLSTTSNKDEAIKDFFRSHLIPLTSPKLR